MNMIKKIKKVNIILFPNKYKSNNKQFKKKFSSIS